MDEIDKTTDAVAIAEINEDFMIEDLEERFVQGKWNCSCSCCSCECCSCCLYIF